MINQEPKTLREKREDLAKIQGEVKQEQQDKMSKIFTEVLSTEYGVEFFKYLYNLCGGAGSALRASKDGTIDSSLTFTVLGCKSIYEQIRVHIPDNKIVSIEREKMK